MKHCEKEQMRPSDFGDVRDIVSKFIEQHNIDVNFEDYGGGVESISNPYGSENAVREAILAHEEN